MKPNKITRELWELKTTVNKCRRDLGSVEYERLADEVAKEIDALLKRASKAGL